MTEPAIDSTAEEVGTEIVPVPPAAGLFKTDDPVEIIAQATRYADALKDVVVAKKLVATINGREHPLVEAWQTLGGMLGVYAVPVGEPRALPWPEPVPASLKRQRERGQEFGFTASYVVTKAGETVGGGSARCVRTEGSWAAKDDNAIASMAQTRAISKALSGPLRWVMKLAGYETTPAEEMTAVEQTTQQQPATNGDASVPAPGSGRLLRPKELADLERGVEEEGWKMPLVLAALGVSDANELTTGDTHRIRELLDKAKAN